MFVAVNNNRFQHLADAFDSIISMMLAALRARGLRGLLDLPNMIMTAIFLRRLGREFAALIASLGDLALLPPAPVAPPPPPACTQPDPAPRARPRAPAPRGARRRRPKPAAQPIPASRPPKALRHRAFAWPRRAPAPRATLRLPSSLHETARTP